jgi:nicotinamidase-related amidase
MTSTARLVVDVQQGSVDHYATDEGYLPRLGTATRAARGAGIGIIYVTVTIRPVNMVAATPFTDSENRLTAVGSRLSA